MRILLPIAALAACSRTAAPPPPAADPFAPARAAVLSVLKDPDSARFADLHPGKSDAVCGTVNARNGFGGYTGARAFVWTPGRVLIYDDPADWGKKGIEAEEFAALGCSIGPEQGQALAARRALDEMTAGDQ
jgi:hypothetical protein